MSAALRSRAIAIVLAAALLGAGPGHRADPDSDDSESNKDKEKEESESKEDTGAKKPQSGKGSSFGNWAAHATAETSAYADTDHVSVVSPTIGASAENPISGWSLGGSYLVDVVSAASADIVSTATSRWREIRHAGGANVGYKPGDFGGALSASASVEPDYVSVTGGVTFSWDLYEKNLTLMLGYGFGHDIAGRSGTPFEVFSRQLDRNQINGGASWTVDRATLATLVGDLVLENGDQSKTYRYVPMFLPGTADSVPAGAPVTLVNEKRWYPRPNEQLPLTRQRMALTGRIAHRFTSSTLRAEERLYIDSWALFASTTDARLVWNVADRFAFGPRARFHVQTGTDFWQRAYELVNVNGQLVPPGIRTGDRELGPLFSVTGGIAAEIDMSSVAGSGQRTLSFVADGIYTSYADALYVVDRSAVFGALTFNATFD